jgi:uncharacterized phage protein gp47/JayE
MPYAIPTLAELIQQVQSDLNSADIVDADGNTINGFLEVGIVPVVAGRTLPGFVYEHYGYQAWISKQAVPWTATDEFFSGWAALRGVYQEAPTFTIGTVTFSGTNGTTIPNATPLTRSDGTAFVTTAAGTVASLNVTVPVQAVVAGSAGNFIANTGFTLSNSIANITAQSTGSAQTTAGTDQETFAAFKTRTLAIYASPPQGGDAQDYVEWASAVSGVTRAWVNPNGNGVGTVVVYVMLDIVESAYNGFPQGTNGVAALDTRDTAATGDQLTVANAIYPKQPVTALVYLYAPVADPIPFTINNLGSNNTSAMQTAIKNALNDMFLRYGSVGGTKNPLTLAAWPSIQPSAWYEALAAISGLTSFTVGAPLTPIVPGTGQLPVLGTVTFNT